MNNPNPFVPQGSLLEQQSKRRSRLKLGVFCVLAVGVCGLAAMLIQGCKREETENQPPENQPPVDTNMAPAETNTNQPSMEASNPPVAPTPPEAAQQPPPTPAPQPAPPAEQAPAPTENEYVIVKGDTLSKIAKANGVTVKAIEEANPGVEPTRLKVGQKLVIPAGGATAGATGMETANGGGETYVIKSGDTLSRIARHFGVTVKAIQEANNLSSTKIFVGKKLIIPAKPEAATAPANTPPEAAPAPEPAPAPAPANPPAQPNAPSNQ